MFRANGGLWKVYDMDEKEFKLRLVNLREQKGVSARDMSLSLGQNPGYINNIETGKALPSMASFFSICEYLNISPCSFFDTESLPFETEELDRLIRNIKKLSAEQYQSISFLIYELTEKKDAIEGSAFPVSILFI